MNDPKNDADNRITAFNSGGTISFSGANSIEGTISPSPANIIYNASGVSSITRCGTITIAPNQHIVLKTLGDTEELTLGAHSSVKVTDLNNHLFTNHTDQNKTIVLSGENTTSDDLDNPYA